METAASQAHGACPVLPGEMEAVTMAEVQNWGITGAGCTQQTGVWLLPEPFCGSELTCAPVKSRSISCCPPNA